MSILHHVGEVRETTHPSEVNELLKQGWILIGVYQVAYGPDEKGPIYILGKLRKSH